jgi:hypothetical protein
MRVDVLRAAAGTLLVGAAMSPADAAETYYRMSVDILADDGSVTSHQQVKCRRYERCTSIIPYVLQGRKETLYIKTNVPDDHHIYVIVGPSLRPYVPDGENEPAFEQFSKTQGFEPGNEWTFDLRRMFVVAKDPTQQKTKWDTTDHQWRTVLKVRMKLDD